MLPRPRASSVCVLPSVFLVVLLGIATSAIAQYGGYGGYYQGGGPSGSSSSGGGNSPEPTPTRRPTPRPTATPRPLPEGHISLELSYEDADGVRRPLPARVMPGERVEIRLDLTATDAGPGQFKLSTMALDDRISDPFPSRGDVGNRGSWTVTVLAGEETGNFSFLFFAQDNSGNYRPKSLMGSVIVGAVEPILMADNVTFLPAKDSRQLQLQHRSWWMSLTTRNWYGGDWFEDLVNDLYRNKNLLDAVGRAVRIDRDRLNITHQMPPKEDYRSYAAMEQVMSKYWAETGITLSAMTANEIGNVFVGWRANSGMVFTMSDDIARTLKVSMPVVKIGNVLNGVGAAMILLDFWANMSDANTPYQSRMAWNKAGYASLDLYLSNMVANTFGAAAALPGMFVSYVLNDSYSTLIGGHKRCWFNKMVEQAVDADYLGEFSKDPRAVENVMRAMQSSRGLKDTLDVWWQREAPTWQGMMAGGCGNWDLAEANDYRQEFVDRLMRTAEVEVNGKKYHPWSFYYSVSRKLALEKQKELAREIATNLRTLEGVYISSLKEKQYRATFKLVSASDPDQPLKYTEVRPLEWERSRWWVSGEDGTFVAEVNGHHFSPDGNILFNVAADDKFFVFVVPRSAFAEVTQ